MLIRFCVLATLFCLSKVFGEIVIIEHLDLPYGDNERHKLDVVSSNICKKSPVLIFMHGGSWRWGQKDYHRGIGRQFARNGVLFLSINYRLYPEVRFPEFPRDLARAIKWARDNVERFGGNKKNIFLIGHSAGAHNASLVALDKRYLEEFGGNLKWIKGVIPMACPFQFDPAKEFLYKDLFPEEIETTELMPMSVKTDEYIPPFYIMHGRFDPLLSEDLAIKFANKLSNSGCKVELRIYSSHGHFSLIRRTTSWHIWPFPLLNDVLSFIRMSN